MKWRTAIGATVLALLSLMQVAAIQVPSGLRVGSETLPARSCATRDTLWIHHYAAALYLPQRAAPDAQRRRTAPATQPPAGALPLR